MASLRSALVRHNSEHGKVMKSFSQAHDETKRRLQLATEENARLEAELETVKALLASAEGVRQSLAEGLDKQQDEWTAKYTELDGRRRRLSTKLKRIQQPLLAAQVEKLRKSPAGEAGPSTILPHESVATVADQVLHEARTLAGEMDAARAREAAALRQVKELKKSLARLQLYAGSSTLATSGDSSDAAVVTANRDKIATELRDMLSNQTVSPPHSPSPLSPSPAPPSSHRSPDPNDRFGSTSTFPLRSPPPTAIDVAKADAARDASQRQAEELREKLDALTAEVAATRDSTTAAISTLESEKSKLLSELDVLRLQAVVLQGAVRKAKAAADASDKATMEANNSKFVAELARDAAVTQKEQAVKTEGSIRAERDGLVAAKAALEKDKEELISQQQALHSKVAGLYVEKVNLEAETRAAQQQKAFLQVRSTSAESARDDFAQRTKTLEGMKAKRERDAEKREVEYDAEKEKWRQLLADAEGKLDKRKRMDDEGFMTQEEHAKRIKIVEKEKEALSSQLVDALSQLNTVRSDLAASRSVADISAKRLVEMDAKNRELQEHVELELFHATMDSASNEHARRLTVEGFGIALRKLEKRADQQLEKQAQTRRARSSSDVKS